MWLVSEGLEGEEVGDSKGSFPTDGVSADFAASADSGLDESMLPNAIKVRIDIAKKVSSIAAKERRGRVTL